MKPKLDAANAALKEQRAFADGECERRKADRTGGKQVGGLVQRHLDEHPRVQANGESQDRRNHGDTLPVAGEGFRQIRHIG
ncbi:MAG: hypothetical protein ACREUH_11120 [Burkholderiales bacterium]